MNKIILYHEIVGDGTEFLLDNLITAKPAHSVSCPYFLTTTPKISGGREEVDSDAMTHPDFVRLPPKKPPAQQQPLPLPFIPSFALLHYSVLDFVVPRKLAIVINRAGHWIKSV